MRRLVRKTEDCLLKVGQLSGRKPAVQHSWHDYQSLWERSRLIRDQIRRYRGKLGIFQDEVFQVDVEGLVSEPGLHWKHGFRLLQLAMWRDIVEARGPSQSDWEYAAGCGIGAV